MTAIEADNREALPGDFFHRSFIRQYAKALGLDEPETDRILSFLAPAPEIDLTPILNVPNNAAQVEQQAKPLASVPTRVAVFLLVAVVAGGSALYAIWSRAQERIDPEPQVQTAPPEPSRIASAPPESQPEAVPDPPETRGQELPALPPPEQSAAPAPDDPLKANSSKISVDLSATERTWVSLSSAGRTIFSGILDANGETKNFALDPASKLLTGNAGGLDVRMNGRPLGPLGPKGGVRIVLFSQDQYKIVAPSRM